MKINNKIKVLATRAQKKGICFKANDNIRSIVSVPERYRNNETVVFKVDGEKCYVTATDLVVFFVFKQFWSASGYISKYYKVVFDGYDFQISEASSQAEGFYSDKSGMYFGGMLSYHIVDVGSTGKSSIQLAFSFDGENAFTITKNIPDLTIDYAYYSSESLNFEDVAFDSDGYIYITLFLTLRVNSSSSSQVFEYRQYLCCSKFDDDSPFEILRNTYEGTHEYVLEENYFSEGAIFKEYHQKSWTDSAGKIKAYSNLYHMKEKQIIKSVRRKKAKNISSKIIYNKKQLSMHKNNKKELYNDININENVDKKDEKFLSNNLDELTYKGEVTDKSINALYRSWLAFTKELRI